jgi:predicted hydrocarbon binding protein
MPGKIVRGSVLQGYAGFIEHMWGKNGLETLLKETEIDTNVIKEGKWYSVETSDAILKWIYNKQQKTDNANEPKINYVRECGKFIAKKVLSYIKNATSIERALTTFPDSYDDSFKNLGRFRDVVIDKKKKQASVQFFEAKVSEYFCYLWLGTFEGMLEMHDLGKDCRVEETKCMHKGSDVCEYLIKWT